MSGGPNRGWIVWAVIVAAVVAVVLVRPDSSDPYDLGSAAPDGYKALRLLLEESGTEVDEVDAAQLGPEAVASTPVAFVPVADTVPADLADRWTSYVRAGGRLVLGTRSKALGVGGESFDESGPLEPSGSFRRRPGTCDLFDPAGLRSIELPVSAGDLRHGTDGTRSCYGGPDAAAVVGRPVGSGDLLAVSSPDVFTNELMGMADVDETTVRGVPDNAVVAMRTLAVRPDGTAAPRVAVVTSGIAALPTDGQSSLTDLAPRAVLLGLLQLVVAFGYYAVARGRRHGRVVTEPEPTSIAGSAFVGAVGDLLGRQGEHERAAARLRASECRELARRHHLPPSADVRQLVGVLAARTGRDPDEIASILTRPVTDESDLVELSAQLDRLRQEASHV